MDLKLGTRIKKLLEKTTKFNIIKLIYLKIAFKKKNFYS
jgi:hypothetical protein